MQPAALTALVVIVSLIPGAFQTGTGPDWIDAGTKDGIALAFRDDASLPAREVRATAELPFPARQVFPVVCDLSAYETIVPGVEEARVLEGAPPGEDIYLRYAPRFLVVAARDVVVRVRRHSDDSAGVFGCTWAEVEGRMAEREATVRMAMLRGAWTVEDVDGARARVVYQFAARPGGRIPDWLVRRGALGALPEVIGRVRRCLAKKECPAD